MNQKKKYEKPVLKGVAMLEAHTGACCRTNTAACKTAAGVRKTKGSSNKTS